MALTDTVRYQPLDHALTVRVENAENNTDSVAVSFVCSGKERDVMFELPKTNPTAGDLRSALGATKSWWTALATPHKPSTSYLDAACPRPHDFEVELEMAFDIDLAQVFYGLGKTKLDGRSRRSA